MAGARRRPEASQAPATSEGAFSTTTPQNPSTTTEGNTRVTRSSRGNRDAGSNNNDRAGMSSRFRSRLSRIVTLKYGRGRARDTASRETRTSQMQSSAPTTSAQSESQDPSLSPHTPRTRRPRRSIALEETPRSTRHSARLKAQLSSLSQEDTTPEGEETKQLDTGAASDDETKIPVEEAQDAKESQNSQDANDTTATFKDRSPEIAENSNLKQSDDARQHSAESDQTEQTSKESSSDGDKKKADQPISRYTSQEPSLYPTNTPSPVASRKRKSHELEDYDTDLANHSVSPSKKAKVEDDDSGLLSEQPLQNGKNGRTESSSPIDGTGESPVDDEHDQNMKDADTTPETGIEISSVARPRGGYRGGRGRRRGRGGRNRQSVRITSNKRGAGRGRGTRARAIRTGRQLINSDNVDFRRSLSPSAEVQKLRDRQRELDKAFRRVAAAQRLALAELATQSEKRITRDKSAHIDVEEYEQVSALLKEKLRQRQTALRKEYDLRVEQEMRLLAAEKERINQKFRDSTRHVQEEHLLAAQGAYMSFVEGRRAAEDDEHTETDASDAEPDGQISQSGPEWVRGFNSSSVRAPAGAAAYHLGKEGWDDFVQRASLGEDIDPQMKEMGQGQNQNSLSSLPAREALSLLLQATGVVAQEEDALNALPILAEAAASRPPALQMHRMLHPQVAPGPSLTLPRPQPRRILPAGGQQIPPISEQLNLPDPFVGMGPPQLPPPPGSNFHRPPLPGFLHRQPLYYPPPPLPRPPY